MRSIDPAAVVRPACAVLLAGAIRPSPLREALDSHVLSLPIGARGTLLDAWMALLEREGIRGDTRVVVNSEADVDLMNATARATTWPNDRRPSLRAIAEPAAWRGAAGIVGDVTRDVSPNAIVIVCEAKRLPPHTLEPLIGALSAGAGAVAAVGVCGRDEPAGVYAFAASALSAIPRLGYYDLKEQFLPALAWSGGEIAAAHLGDCVHRLHDVRGYIAAVGASLRRADADGPALRISQRASVSSSAILDGACIVEDNAVIEDGAVVHDSVVLAGATIGGGAVVSRCIVGRLATVEPRSRVIGECLRRAIAHGRSSRPIAALREPASRPQVRI